MIIKMKIKKGDKVTVISGKDKGTSGVVLKALPKTRQIVVEGVHVVKKHKRARPGQKGTLIEKPLPIHVSNVKKAA